ncbi:hypothetical protein [Bradyrhizobium sp. RDM4]
MTTTLVWTGVALWLGFSAFVVFGPSAGPVKVAARSPASVATVIRPDAMQIALVKRQPKRRCRIPRRPHPNLDYFFGRLEHTKGDMRDDTGPETADPDHPSPRRH